MDLRAHDWHEQYDWCRRCGQGAYTLLERGDDRCLSGPNVIAISHIIAERRYQPLIDAVRVMLTRRPVCDDPTPPSAA